MVKVDFQVIHILLLQCSGFLTFGKENMLQYQKPLQLNWSFQKFIIQDPKY